MYMSTRSHVSHTYTVQHTLHTHTHTRTHCNAHTHTHAHTATHTSTQQNDTTQRNTTQRNTTQHNNTTQYATLKRINPSITELVLSCVVVLLAGERAALYELQQLLSGDTWVADKRWNMTVNITADNAASQDPCTRPGIECYSERTRWFLPSSDACGAYDPNMHT